MAAPDDEAGLKARVAELVDEGMAREAAITLALREAYGIGDLDAPVYDYEPLRLETTRPYYGGG